MIRVDAQTAYPLSTPGARVRLGGYVAPLGDHGVDLGITTTLTDREYAVISSQAPVARKAVATIRSLGRTVAKPAGDITLVQRLRSITPVPLIDPPRHLDAYDFDDALHLGSQGANNATASRLKREAGRWRSYVRRSRLVIAGNGYLATAAREAGASRVEVVPSCVDPAAYIRRKHDEVDTVTVGWIGSASTAPYLEVVLAAMERLTDAGTRVRLVAVGAGDLPARPWLESRPWRLDQQAPDLSGFDIGVMPMPDDPWTRGKCGYKLLQYFAAGVPAVASPVGVAAAMVGEQRGRLARDQGDWIDAIRDLARDAVARREMGSAAVRFVDEEYSYRRWAPELAGMFRELS